jgi:DNA-binding transcriptional regulator PaaX
MVLFLMVAAGQANAKRRSAALQSRVGRGKTAISLSKKGLRMTRRDVRAARAAAKLVHETKRILSIENLEKQDASMLQLLRHGLVHRGAKATLSPGETTGPNRDYIRVKLSGKRFETLHVFDLGNPASITGDRLPAEMRLVKTAKRVRRTSSGAAATR